MKNNFINERTKRSKKMHSGRPKEDKKQMRQWSPIFAHKPRIDWIH
jgi:hypothetical protein